MSISKPFQYLTVGSLVRQSKNSHVLPRYMQRLSGKIAWIYRKNQFELDLICAEHKRANGNYEYFSCHIETLREFFTIVHQRPIRLVEEIVPGETWNHAVPFIGSYALASDPSHYQWHVSYNRGGSRTCIDTTTLLNAYVPRSRSS
jgi:hypothetical protein